MLLSESYNCIIIDDEEIDRLTTLSFVRRYLFLNICGVCSSAKEALEILKKEDIHILFSDIDMPDINGFEFRRKLMHIPVCIFITMYADFAVESFELAAFDFLVKPLKSDRFEATIRRIKAYMVAIQKANLYEYSLGADTIFIKDGHTFIKIKLYEIVYLEALKDYTLIHTANNRHCVLSPLGQLLENENFKTFVRVHRSYAVQKNLIDQIKPNKVSVNNIIIPVGRNYKDNLEPFKI